MKFFKFFLLLVLCQFFVSCCNNNTYEVTISGIESRPLLFDNNIPVIVDEKNTINKEDLVFELIIKESELIVSNKSHIKEKSLQVFEASVIPCGDNEFIYTNKIIDIKVEILDIETNQTIDVTNRLVIYNSDQFITSYIKENSYGLRNYYFKFSDINDLPNKIEYNINVHLDDGNIFNSEGVTINFN